MSDSKKRKRELKPEKPKLPAVHAMSAEEAALWCQDALKSVTTAAQTDRFFAKFATRQPPSAKHLAAQAQRTSRLHEKLEAIGKTHDYKMDFCGPFGAPEAKLHIRQAFPVAFKDGASLLEDSSVVSFTNRTLKAKEFTQHVNIFDMLEIKLKWDALIRSRRINGRPDFSMPSLVAEPAVTLSFDHVRDNMRIQFEAGVSLGLLVGGLAHDTAEDDLEALVDGQSGRSRINRLVRMPVPSCVERNVPTGLEADVIMHVVFDGDDILAAFFQVCHECKGCCCKGIGRDAHLYADGYVCESLLNAFSRLSGSKMPPASESVLLPTFLPLPPGANVQKYSESGCCWRWLTSTRGRELARLEHTLPPYQLSDIDEVLLAFLRGQGVLELDETKRGGKSILAYSSSLYSYRVKAALAAQEHFDPATGETINGLQKWSRSVHITLAAQQHVDAETGETINGLQKRSRDGKVTKAGQQHVDAETGEVVNGLQKAARKTSATLKAYRATLPVPQAEPDAEQRLREQLDALAARLPSRADASDEATASAMEEDEVVDEEREHRLAGAAQSVATLAQQTFMDEATGKEITGLQQRHRTAQATLAKQEHVIIDEDTLECLEVLDGLENRARLLSLKRQANLDAQGYRPTLIAARRPPPAALKPILPPTADNQRQNSSLNAMMKGGASREQLERLMAARQQAAAKGSAQKK